MTNIEVADSNIKAFERFENEYGVDFAVKRDASQRPPKYLVFFKAPDTDAMTAAFREFPAKTIKRENKPSILFLGGKEPSKLKSISESQGKETIDTYSESDMRGQQRSHGLNYQKLGKPLMMPDELAIMPGSRCILQLQGVHPFYSRKYDITKHPMYPLLADADEGNRFEVGKRLKNGCVTIDESI